MPALAVTEHGNMFSSVIFHDHAKQRGVKPILGCEVYVAPGSRLTKTGTIGETANHLVLLAETDEGTTISSSSSRPALPRASTTSRVSTRSCWRSTRGLIGLSSCLKGEVATEIRNGRGRKALEVAAQFPDILGAGNFFLELQFQGIDEQLVVNKGWCRSHATSTCRLWPPTTFITSRRAIIIPTTSCCASAREKR